MNLNTDISNHLDENTQRKVKFDKFKMKDPIKPDSIPKYRHDTNSVYSLGIKYSSKKEKKPCINMPNIDYFSINYKKMQNKLKSDKTFSETYAQRVLLNKNTIKNYVCLEKPFPLINKISSSTALNQSKEFISSITNSPMSKEIKKNLNNLYKIRLMKKFKIKKQEKNENYENISINTIDKNATFIIKDIEKSYDLGMATLRSSNVELKKFNELKSNKKNESRNSDLFIVDSNFGHKLIKSRNKKNNIDNKINNEVNKKNEFELLREREKEEVEKIANDMVNSFKYQKYKNFHNTERKTNNNNITNFINFNSDYLKNKTTFNNPEDIFTPKFKENNRFSKNVKENYSIIDHNDSINIYNNNIINNNIYKDENYINYSCFSSLQSNFLTAINFKKTSKKNHEKNNLNVEKINENEIENENMDKDQNNYIKNIKTFINYNTTEERNSTFADIEKKVLIKSKINSKIKILNDNVSIKKKNKITDFFENDKSSSLMDVSKYPFNKINKEIIIKKNKDLFNVKSIEEKDETKFRIRNKIEINKHNKSQTSMYNLNKSNTDDNDDFIINKENNKCIKKTNQRNFGLNSIIYFNKNNPDVEEYLRVTLFKSLDNCLDVNNNKYNINSHERKYNTDLKTIRNKPKQFVPNYDKYKITPKNNRDDFLNVMKNKLDKREKLLQKFNQRNILEFTNENNLNNNDINFNNKPNSNKNNFKHFKNQSNTIQTFFNGSS
jgi:hypothetical protein